MINNNYNKQLGYQLDLNSEVIEIDLRLIYGFLFLRNIYIFFLACVEEQMPLVQSFIFFVNKKIDNGINLILRKNAIVLRLLSLHLFLYILFNVNFCGY